jgi:putative NADH-flavin reductase
MDRTILLVGGTGRTGPRALKQLLDRGISVRAIVPSGGKLPPDVTGNPNMTVIEACLLSFHDEELQQHLRGCDAVISCLDHIRGLLPNAEDGAARAGAASAARLVVSRCGDCGGGS